jgi:hypothetical protein
MSNFSGSKSDAKGLHWDLEQENHLAKRPESSRFFTYFLEAHPYGINYMIPIRRLEKEIFNNKYQ